MKCRNDMIENNGCHVSRVILMLKERFGEKMEKIVLFLNAFLSYLLVMAVIVILAGVAIFIGIKMRKRKNEQTESENNAAGV